MNLFNIRDEKWSIKYRPKTLLEVFGHKNIINILKNGNLSNMILCGPSGVGKTTLAYAIANTYSYDLQYINATLVTKDELTDAIKRAKNSLNKTIIFIDEIHRLNKMQQDYLLVDLENSDIIFIGATTENPNSRMNKAVLSRMKIYYLNELSDKDIYSILEDILKKEKLILDKEKISYIVKSSKGDARVAINNLELIFSNNLENKDIEDISKVIYMSVDSNRVDYISALIKSIRGSDVNASVYWLAALIHTGEDIEYIARRLVISASEDIGLANPNALVIANSCLESISKIGMPEARIILSQTAIYLASSPKSNTSYLAINKALKYIQENGIDDVLYHLTHIGKDRYKYPHDYTNSYVFQKYMKQDIEFVKFSNNKMEQKIKEYLNKLRGENENRN